MTTYTEGQPVVVIERRHPLAYEEGTVNRPQPDSFGRIRVDFAVQGGDNGSGKTWTAIEREALAPVPQICERRRWRRDYRASLYALGPFTLTSRGIDEDRLYTLRYDDALYADGIASAAELARFSVPYTEPDGAEDGTTGETRVVVETPRQGAATLDTLRDVVLETALAWDAEPDGFKLYEHREAIRAYRTARDS